MTSLPPTPPHPSLTILAPSCPGLPHRWITSDVGPDALENWSVFYDNWFTGESGDKARTPAHPAPCPIPPPHPDPSPLPPILSSPLPPR